jgi:uncharacterized membrane protein
VLVLVLVVILLVLVVVVLVFFTASGPRATTTTSTIRKLSRLTLIVRSKRYKAGRFTYWARERGP